MLATIVYWVGVILSVYCVYELFVKKTATPLTTKLLVALFTLLTSWIGLVVYFFILRDKLK